MLLKMESLYCLCDMCFICCREVLQGVFLLHNLEQIVLKEVCLMKALQTIENVSQRVALILERHFISFKYLIYQKILTLT